MKQIISNIFYLASLSIAFIIPMPDKLVSPFLSIWIILLLLLLATSGFRITRHGSKRLQLILFISFSLWSLITLLYSENADKGFELLERRIILLIIPIFLLFTDNHTHRKRLLQSFILGNYVLIIYITAIFLISYFSETSTSLFSNKSLIFKETLIKFKHHTYIGTNLSLCLLSIAYIVKGSKSFKAHLWLGVSAIAGFVIIYLTYARMAFMVYSLTIFYVYFVILFKKKKVLSWILASSIIITICVIAISNNTRFTSILSSEEISLKHNSDNIGYYHRIGIWTKSLELIKDKPLIGYGLGDSVKAINWSYKKRYYDAHNQFFEFLIEGGIISLLLFFIPAIWIFFMNNGRKNQWFSIGVLGIFILVMLTESILNRIAGISSFALFFWIMHNEEPSSDQDTNIPVFSGFSFIMLSGLILSLSIVLFTSIFNSKNPRTYSNRVSKIINYQDLPGIIPDFLPEKTKGYLLDSNTNASSWNGNAYAYTPFANIDSTNYDCIHASVYCYVSEDFNGQWVRLSAEGSKNEKNVSFYDLTKKGTWQFLEIEPEFSTGRISLLLFLSKYNCINFDKLEGYVIFAYPQYNKTPVMSDVHPGQNHDQE